MLSVFVHKLLCFIMTDPVGSLLLLSDMLLHILGYHKKKRGSITLPLCDDKCLNF